MSGLDATALGKGAQRRIVAGAVNATAFGFVGSIAAVRLAIALRPRRDALAVGFAKERLIVAFRRHIATEFVVSLGTLRISVAHPFLLDADVRIVAFVFGSEAYVFAMQTGLVHFRQTGAFAIAQLISLHAQPIFGVYRRDRTGERGATTFALQFIAAIVALNHAIAALTIGYAFFLICA